MEMKFETIVIALLVVVFGVMIADFIEKAHKANRYQKAGIQPVDMAIPATTTSNP